MKKTDLKVGEVYAIWFTPGQNRSHSYYEVPHKATLVEVSGTIEEKLTVVAYRGDGYTAFKRRPKKDWFETTVRETGVIVDLAVPVQRGEISPSGLYVEGRYHKGRAKYHPVEGFEKDEVEAQPNMVTRIALKNAGCFQSTWADYLADKKAAAEAKKERQAQLAAERDEAIEQDPANRLALEKVLTMLREKGWKVERSYGYGNDASTVEPDEIEVTRVDQQFSLELRYYGERYWPPKGTPFVGFNVKDMDGDILASLLF